MWFIISIFGVNVITFPFARDFIYLGFYVGILSRTLGVILLHIFPKDVADNI